MKYKNVNEQGRKCLYICIKLIERGTFREKERATNNK